MAYAITCAQSGIHITYDEHCAIIHYSCGYVEYENCYFKWRREEVKAGGGYFPKWEKIRKIT